MKKNYDESIFYIGRFELPDKDATALRIVTNAKLISEIGYRIVLVGWTSRDKYSKRATFSTHFGFECWELSRPRKILEHLHYMFSTNEIERILDKYDDLRCVIMYNYPSPSFLRIQKYCQKRGVKVVSDITEWYGYGSKSLISESVKFLDTYFRMSILNKSVDGVIVISSFLEKYYFSSRNLILIPPLVDISDPKWKRQTNENILPVIIYSGSPSATKERLDLVVRSIINYNSLSIKVYLWIVGIDYLQFCRIYKSEIQKSNFENAGIIFFGRLGHIQSLNLLKRADYSIIPRDVNLTTSAGFPSKFSESISCQTPVISTRNSDIPFYLDKGVNGYMFKLNKLEDELDYLLKNRIRRTFNNTIFDYHNYKTKFDDFLKKLFSS